MKKLLLLTLLLVTSCQSEKPGKNVFRSSTGASADLQSAQNAKDGTSQTITIDREIGYGLQYRDIASIGTNLPYTVRTHEQVITAIGGTWQDVAKIVGAKFKAFLPFLFCAIGLGIVSGVFFYFGQMEKGAIAAVGAIACLLVYTIFPQLGVGALVCIVIGVALLALLVLAVKYRALWDQNKNFVPDVLERKTTDKEKL